MKTKTLQEINLAAAYKAFRIVPSASNWLRLESSMRSYQERYQDDIEQAEAKATKRVCQDCAEAGRILPGHADCFTGGM